MLCAAASMCAQGAVIINFGQNSPDLPGTNTAVTTVAFSDLMDGTTQLSAYTTGTFSALPSGNPGSGVSFDVVVNASADVQAQPGGLGVAGGRVNAAIDNGDGNGTLEWISFQLANVSGLGAGDQLVITSVLLDFLDTAGESYRLDIGTSGSAPSAGSEVVIPGLGGGAHDFYDINNAQFTIGAGSAGDTRFVIQSITVDVVDEPAMRPNVLFIAIDDLRPDLNCYEETAAEQMGGPSARLPIHSPAIDLIAAEGMVFERAYCQVPLCGPSRVSIMTGTYPDRTEIYGMSDAYGGNWRTFVPDGATIVSLPQQFRNHGYYAASYGKIYDPRLGVDLGISWDEESTTYRGYIDSENGANRAAVEAADVADNQYTDGKTADKALGFLAAHDTNTPFFLAVGFAKPHLPFNAPKHYWDLYDPAALPLGAPTNLPAGLSAYTLSRPYKELETYTQPVTYAPIVQPTPEPLTRQLVHGYLACISYVDALIGKIIDDLKARGLYDNTIVVVWGDHGFKLADFGEWAKATTLEIDSRVPLIIRLPASMAADRNAHSYSMVEFVDVLPTVCEVAGLPIPDTAQGRSLVPILQHAKASVRQTALTQYRRTPGMAYSVRSAQWRYTEFRTMAGDLVERQLFDLSAIPHVETVNVVDTQSYFPDALSALIFDCSPTTGGSVENPVPATVQGMRVSGDNFLADFSGSGTYSVWKSRSLSPPLFTGPDQSGVVMERTWYWTREWLNLQPSTRFSPMELLHEKQRMQMEKIK